MNVRAVVFDVYGTLLDVAPPSGETAQAWDALWQGALRLPPRMTRAEFSTACSQVIAREHEGAASRGIAHPEIVWPSVVGEVLPEFAALTSAGREEFIYRQIRTAHTVALSRGVAGLLPCLRKAGFVLGIASNAQAYTVRELREALAAVGLSFEQLFEPGLCFWSFEHGFSKPNPHVFQILGARLEARGVTSAEILMVGDRLDNDVAPARAHGWKTWWLTEKPGVETGGDWRQLKDSMAPRPSAQG